MAEGYLICRKKEEAVGQYDEELSKMFGLHVFWIGSGEVTAEREKKCDGRFFRLDEVIFAGLKDLADKMGFEKYQKDKRK
jgi:hypothetical protein